MKKILPIVIIMVALIGAGLFFILKNDDTDGTVESASTNQSNAQASSNTPISGTSNATTPSKTTYSKADVATHNNKSDCWTIINGNVYDITSYVPIHPGGVAEITRACGKDGTSLFTSNPQHDSRATNELANLKIGTLN